MNAALLVISSALATGGDVTPAGAWGDSPAVVQAQACANCGPTVASSSCGCAKASILDRIKACCTPKHSSGCAPAPSCDSCSKERSYRPNLLDKIKSCCKKPDCCGPTVSPCDAPIAPIPTTTPAAPPKDMPKLKDVPKTGNSGTSSLAPVVPLAPSIAPTPTPSPNPIPIVPAIPAAPISTPSSPNGASPY